MTATCTLTVISGPAAGSVVEVERELIIGRRDADLTIPDEELSRRHAAVRPSDSGVVIEDLGSLNGTFVDGGRIDAPVTLTADATLRVGISEMSLRLAPAEPESEFEPEPEQQAEGQALDPGRTRMASTLPQEPAPIPQPEVTRVRQVPDVEPQAPVAIPQPQVTRVRQVPDAELQAAPSAIPQPQVTRVRQVPDADSQQPAAIPLAQPTRVRDVAAGEGVAQPDASASSGSEAQSKRPGLFKRLLGRIRGGSGDGEGAAT